MRTARLELRALQRSDADAILPLFADWKVVRYLSSPPWPYSRDDALAFVDGIVNRAGPHPETVFAICREGALIGCIGHRQRPAGHLQRAPGLNIGYWLGQLHWNHGYMTEALQGLAAGLFADETVDTIYSGAFSENAASLRVQAKAGFVHDGETMLVSRPRNGEFHHTNTVLTRNRFESVAR